MNYRCNDCDSDFGENEVVWLATGNFACVECFLKNHTSDELGITNHHANNFFKVLDESGIRGNAAGTRIKMAFIA